MGDRYDFAVSIEPGSEKWLRRKAELSKYPSAALAAEIANGGMIFLGGSHNIDIAVEIINEREIKLEKKASRRHFWIVLLTVSSLVVGIAAIILSEIDKANPSSAPPTTPPVETKKDAPPEG